MDKQIQEIVSELESLDTAKTLRDMQLVLETKAIVQAMGIIADKLERIARALEKQYKYAGSGREI